MTHALQVHFCVFPVADGVLLKYALADERKRSELLTVYAVEAATRRRGLTSVGSVMDYPILRMEVTVMLVEVRTV